jgi:hypothetical protein
MIMVATPMVRAVGAGAMFVRFTAASRVTYNEVNGELLRAKTLGLGRDGCGPTWWRCRRAPWCESV